MSIITEAQFQKMKRLALECRTIGPAYVHRRRCFAYFTTNRKNGVDVWRKDAHGKELMVGANRGTLEFFASKDPDMVMVCDASGNEVMV